MKIFGTHVVMAAAAALMIIAGCYTQFESTEGDQLPPEVAYAEPDTLEEIAGSVETYADARYRFYVNVGYPYWTPYFGIGFWDPYPYDPWLWGPPAYWYPYGAYYAPAWYYPYPVAYYPPGYWHGSPDAVYSDGYAGRTNRTFGATRGSGSMRTASGTYRLSPTQSTSSAGVRSGTISGTRPASTRPALRATPGPQVQEQKEADPASVGRTAASPSGVRSEKQGTRSKTPGVSPAPQQRKPRDSGSRPSATPQRAPTKKPEGSSIGSRSGGSRSYSSPPSSSSVPRSSGSTGSAPRSGPSGGGTGASRGGGRR